MPKPVKAVLWKCRHGILAVAILATALVLVWQPSDRVLNSLAFLPWASAADNEGNSEPEHTNHLINETSPYLLQHAHNPVDWHPWGDKAFQKARQEGKPIFLSVGYSTCHWCHVMARKSFENEQIARILNEQFVAIKVDREERPAVDEQYMLATQIVTGSGGWPNSVWLTPEAKPFMAGTYFPPEQFKQILNRIAGLWSTRREELEQQADRLNKAVQRASSTDRFGVGGAVNQQVVDQGVDALRNAYDGTHGGFGGAPWFPPHDALRLLIREYRRTEDSQLLNMVNGTLDGMARGGVRDHVGGGFHRYSTDARWFLPHFEKMLYDNAQLLRIYTDGYLLTGDERYRRVVAGTFDWMNRVMRHPQGGFYSALNSETDGEEGKYHVWEYAEVREILGEENAELFTDVYGFEAGGNYREEASGQRTGANIVYLPKPVDRYARQHGLDADELRADLQRMRSRLLEARNRRERPHLDDKVLTSWNGLAIASLACAGRELDEPRYTQAAEDAAGFIREHMLQEDRLLRSFRKGTAHGLGYLNDYAFLAEGMLELYRSTGERRWLEDARRLADLMLDNFEDKQNGGFFFTTEEHDNRLMRTRNLLSGGNIPNGNAVAAQVLLRLGRLTNEKHYAQAAQNTLQSLAGVMRQSPRGADSLILAAATYLHPLERSAASMAKTEHADLPEPDARHQKGPVTAEVFASRLKLRPGDKFRVAVALTIADGWHLYGPNGDFETVIPTTVQFADHAVLEAGQPNIPEARKLEDPVLNRTLNVYKGRIWFRLPVTVLEDAEHGRVELKLHLRSQACNDNRCLAPRETTLTLPVTVTKDTGETGSVRHPSIFRPAGATGD